MVATIEDPRITRTRAVLLEATLTVLSRSGFAGASIDAISKESGVARSTIYRHWPERSDLLIDSVAHALGDPSLSMVDDLRDDLVEVGTHLAELLASEPVGSVVAALILESRRDPALDEIRQRFVAQRAGLAVSAIAEAIARGELPDDTDPMDFATEIAGPIFFRALVLHMPVDRPWVEQHVGRWLGRYDTSSEES